MAGREISIPEVLPTAPNHRKSLISRDNQQKELPNYMVPTVCVETTPHVVLTRALLSQGVFKRSGICRLLYSSRACLHTALIAVSVDCVFIVPFTPAVLQWRCLPDLPGWAKSIAIVPTGHQILTGGGGE